MFSLIPIFALAIPSASAETRVCEAQLMGPESPFAFARIEVDQEHAIIDTTVLYSTDGFAASWRINGGSLDASSTLTYLNLPGVTLPHDIVFPVTVYFLVEGKEVASRSFAGPTQLVVHTSEAKPPPWAGQPRPGKFFPGVELEVDPAAVPKLFGATSAELIVTGGRVGRLATIELPLPDWDRLAGAARNAFVHLEARRIRRMCEKRSSIILTSKHWGRQSAPGR
jgi:hypothetical protein